VFLDSSFINRVSWVDNSCELLDLFELLSKSGSVVKKDQHATGRCNHYCPKCAWLDDVFTDEDALKANGEAIKLGIDFTLIAQDPADPKIFLWAYNTENSAVFTCDKNLLKLCHDHGIQRLCFKASIKILEGEFEGAITERYNVERMSNGDDPFFHYSNNSRCDSHCGLKSSCVCFE